ncbi:MAG TPA: M23 family metallopeptidase [Thermoanaerobaculia bacterium]|nr:M23 family metallopeptidase [Thermoanaerobaculia bacterium]
MPRQHTVIFVPHARAKLRKWQINNVQIALAALAFALLTIFSSWLTWSYFNTSVSPAEMARLRRENSRLRQVNQGFEASIKTLQGRLTSSEDRTRQLAIMAGLESLGSGAEVGIGGGSPIEDAGAEDLAALQSRAGQINGALEAIEAKLEERVHWISSTPTIAPVRGILTSGFGIRSDPMTHGPGIHQGIDIAAAAGQPVQAAADGVVMLAAATGGYGQAIFISHGFGLSTRYGHLSEIGVHSGQRVRRGEVIGRVGNSGRSTGSHLHYEVRQDGAPVNPLAYILDSASGPS